MMKVTLVDPERIVYEGLAESVFVPGEYGEFEVLTFHCSIMSTLKKGVVRIDDQFFDIEHGIMKMNENNEITILVNN